MAGDAYKDGIRVGMSRSIQELRRLAAAQSTDERYWAGLNYAIGSLQGALAEFVATEQPRLAEAVRRAKGVVDESG